MVKLGGLNQNNTGAGAANDATQNGAVTWASKLLVILLVVVALVVASSIGVGMVVDKDAAVKKDQYQAVFLENGQVYFGKLSNINKSYVTLTDIYYLQVDQQVQPEQDGEEETDTKESQPQVTLTKLGSELHGPEDAMFIDRDKIVFWENLKSDSRVVQKIGEAKAQ